MECVNRRPPSRLWLAAGNLAIGLILSTVTGSGYLSSAPHAPFKGTPLRLMVPIAGQALHFEPTYIARDAAEGYWARGPGYAVTLEPDTLRVDLAPSRPTPNESRCPAPWAADMPTPIRLRLLAADHRAALVPEKLEPGVSNYFLGSDPAHWRHHVEHYGAVRIHAAYPGVDWLIYGNHGGLEYDFMVAPGGDPSAIDLEVDGADRLTLDPAGDLLIEAAGHALVHRRPIVYQEGSSGQREPVVARYVLAHRHVRFALGRYDHRRALVIDPPLAFSSYLGGSSNDYATGIAVDGQGNIYVAGVAGSVDFPLKNAYQTGNSSQSAFIAKFDPSGTQLIYSTFLGTVSSLAAGLIVDSAGSVYVAGTTTSSNFPVLNAFQPTYNAVGEGNADGFVTKLSPTGDALVYSSYLGGSKQTIIHGLALGAGALYVAGNTTSLDFPTINALQPTLKGRGNAFVAEVSATGNALVFSTYLGGSAFDSANSIALDSTGNIYLGGSTNSVDFPTLHPFQSANLASVNSTALTGFVTKLNPTGSAVLYGSYLGGSDYDVIFGIAVDDTGSAYVTGGTGSSDFPTVNAYQSTSPNTLGGFSGFVAKVTPSGDALAYSTYLGGSGGGQTLLGDTLNAIAVDGSGDAYVTGWSSSTNYPTLNAVQASNNGAANGSNNVVVSELGPSGTALLFSTYLGGAGSDGNQEVHTPLWMGDAGAAIAVDGAGNIYVAGSTESSDFPTLNSYQSTNRTTTQYGSNQNAFVAKFGTEVSPSSSPSSGGKSRGGGGLDMGTLVVLSLVWVASRRRIVLKATCTSG